MKRIIIIIAMFLSTQLTISQINEFGLFLGGSNYIGDIGSTQFINPNSPAYGLIYKWNKSPRHAWRFSYIQSTLTARDIESENQTKKLRNLSFKNNIKEISGGLEFNFNNFDLFSGKSEFTPYIYSGVSYFFYDENYYVGNQLKFDKSSSNIAIPMTLGLKYKISSSFVLALEAGARYTFTDNLDGTNPKNNNLKALRFANKESNDWYVFTGFSITYTFGKKPCYCE